MWREQQQSPPAAKLVVHGAFVEGDLDIANLTRRFHEWYRSAFAPRS